MWQITGNASNFVIGVVNFTSVDVSVNGTLKGDGSIYWSGLMLAYGSAGPAGGNYCLYLHVNMIVFVSFFTFII